MPTGVLRIAVAPGADGRLAATTECRPTSGHFAPDNGGQSSTQAVSLRSLRLAGGLGAHKWVDRSLLDRAQDELAANELPLIVDGDGSVLEASRANVFAVRDGVLLTPPLDGRILPGVTRMRAIELAAELGIEAREAGLSLDDLVVADEVFLTGSVRGVEPVVAIDGTALSGGGNLTAELSTELRRTWVRAKVG
jgi:branched-subunit amino acid aminotransferase/4-amino-4-deoxychorismate lyase